MIEAFWSLSVEQALAATHGSNAGLGKAEAGARLRRDGSNAIGDTEHLSAFWLLAHRAARTAPLAKIVRLSARWVSSIRSESPAKITV